jgi:16S rRNA (uracil1498-N3)-methyltransferase
MHRFYLPPEQTRGSELILTDDEAHHAINVLRIKAGERVIVLNGVGLECLCEARDVSRKTVTLSVTQHHSISRLPYRLTLLQAMTKGKTMDVIVQKATELGVDRIVPITSDRTVSQIEPESAAQKVQKWRNTAIEALKQCGSTWLPQIESPIGVQAFLATQDKVEMSLIATLQNNAKHPREYFQNFLGERNRLPETLAVWIGPEGDFTPAETNLVIASGALPISLGELILRSETAAIYSLSVLNYELQAPRH